jgi:hypothetical protein
MRQAVLAIEDRRFFEHPGVDPIGIVGAVISNIRAARLTGAAASRSRWRATCFFPRCFLEMTLQAARESRGAALSEMWVSLIITARA